MIKFEIISKYKELPPKIVTVYFSQFLIGNTKKSQVKLLPKTSHHFPLLKCEFKKNRLYFKTLNKLPFFLNDKKILGTTTVTVNDKLKIDSFDLKILEISPDIMEQNLNHEYLYDHFYTNKEEYSNILNAIEKELIYSSDEIISAQKGNSSEL